MSYDLYFYKRKETALSEQEIINFLTITLDDPGDGNQWFVNDEDAEAYFSMDLNEPDIEDDPYFDDFDYTLLSFNLNFIRPDFFGIHAFNFIDKLIDGLDLYVFNPQSASETGDPEKPAKGELYKNWSELNKGHSIRYFEEFNFGSLPIEKSNDAYYYNLNRKQLQKDLGNGYFVPKLYFFQKKSDNSIFTLSSWTEHIPNVFPPADYFLITKKYKKFFRTINESGIVSSKTLFDRFAGLMDDFKFKDCKVISIQNSEKAKNLFNSIEFELDLNDFAERVTSDKIVNI